MPNDHVLAKEREKQVTELACSVGAQTAHEFRGRGPRETRALVFWPIGGREAPLAEHGHEFDGPHRSVDRRADESRVEELRRPGKAHESAGT
jgi:hypothetical protein